MVGGVSRVPDGILLKTLVCALLYALSHAAHLRADEGVAAQRVVFQQAEKELASGAGNRFQELRLELAGYPLLVDLDFQIVLGQLHNMGPQAARDFVAQAAGTPLAGRFLVAYLRHKGEDRRWQDFLGAIDTPPDMPELQCYYYRALYGTGERERAFEGARSLWNVGVSQEEACDPLFEVWVRAGGIDDDLVWARALKAFSAKTGHLIRYVKRFASADLGRDLDELASVYRKPSRVTSDRHRSSDRHTDILTAGIERLAQLNPERAFDTLTEQQSRHVFSEEQLRRLESSIIRHSLFAERAPAPIDWVRARLAVLKDDELSSIYLRGLIGAGDWQGYLAAVEWLSTEAQQEEVWQYWRGRALEVTQRSGAETIWLQLADARSFHGFLAAERAGRAYALNRREPMEADQPLWSDSTRLGIGRAEELLALGRQKEAKEQWRHTLNNNEAGIQEQLGGLALERGWTDLATDAANAAGAWDRLDLRFPRSYWALFEAEGARRAVSPWALISIARRESGLYPLAQSKVGARGLMQLMPATARAMARRTDTTYQLNKLFVPEANVAWGSAYYAQLLERFDGNRVQTLAAYNAGPTRVDRWRNGTLEFDQWVDSLPFRETREYVHAVLAYNVIYQLMAGENPSLLTQAERSARY